MISEHMKKNSSWYLCHFPRISGFKWDINWNV